MRLPQPLPLPIGGREPAAVPSLYAPWEPAEMLARTGRKRAATRLLRRANVFPQRGDKCLEVGCGELGWLADLVGWGLCERHLCGIDSDQTRLMRAREAMPAADLRHGDATSLPWESNRFRLVIASTVFSSVADGRTRQQIADEIVRVLVPGGALLWYDMAVTSPNPRVRAIGRRELRGLFSALSGEVRSATLAPVLARVVAPQSWLLGTTLESIPFLRTHLLAVLLKPA